MFQITTPLPGPLAENCTWAPGLICGETGEIVILEPVTMVTLAEADLLGSATAAAVTVTTGVAGIVEGAVYRPELEIVPHADPLQPLPVTLHFTALFVVPLTLAENCCCTPVETWAVRGDTEIDTEAAAWITTDAELDFVGLATEVAVTVASDGVGIFAGAV
jgi:hypothetical protein